MSQGSFHLESYLYLYVYANDLLFAANDWTMYPFSTQNPQDFKNLLSIYLDAVFQPKLRELDFW